jgi:signal transduction histidine kinase
VFGHLPLAMVLLVLYLSTWLAFRASRRAFSPVIALARQVRGLDPAAPDPALLDPARLPCDATCVNDVLTDEIERARLLAGGKSIESRLSATRLSATHRLHVDAPEKVLAVLLGNLLRNAFSYTDAGEVTVDLSPRRW